MHSLSGSILLFGLTLIGQVLSGNAQEQRVPEALMKSPLLKVRLRDNSTSPGQLRGLQSLFHRVLAPNFDAFDPDTPGASAGLNFEHIISGHRNANNKFTPRSGNYRLTGVDESSAALIREAQDSPWQVSSKFRY